MKLAFFLPDLTRGGAERVFLLVASELARRKHVVTLCTAGEGGPWKERIPAGVQHVAFGQPKAIRALPQLVAFLRCYQPDVLLSSVMSANLTAILAARIAGVPCIIRDANRAADDSYSPSQFGTWMNRHAMAVLYPKADAVISLSRDLADHIAALAHVPRNRIRVIPNPIDFPVKRTFSAQRDPRLIMACGRLVPQKDFGTLLRAFGHAALRSDIRLLIVGEGVLRSELESIARELGISDAVRFVGHHDALGDLLEAATLFVSSSIFEGFPNVLLEALAHGCRIVSTDSSDAVGIILADGALGEIVPVGDSAALGAAITRALKNPAPDAAAVEGHVSNFSTERIASEYERLAVETCARGAR